MLNNQVVIVTGGAGLIGSSFVEKISNSNGIAVIADINKEKAAEVVQRLRNIDCCNVDSVIMNINSASSIQSAIDILHVKYGRIDAVVNNAYPRNANFGADLFSVKYEDFCENINLHLGGYFLTSQKFSDYFITQGFGNIINMSSIYGVVAPKFEIYDGTNMTNPVEYAAIKGAVQHMTRYFAKYLKGKNIRVNSLSPGGILDGQPESFLNAYKKQCLNKGMLDVNDITGTLLYLLSDFSKHVNGQNIIVDDGFTL
jgi:NAD(P)-dependent dehydrogenase (short-subunit alcohol dehydrogenase family)